MHKTPHIIKLLNVLIDEFEYAKLGLTSDTISFCEPEFVAKAEIVLNKIYELSIKYIPSTKLAVIADEPDNRMLELAITAQADYIVTGNTRDFTFSIYGGVKIVSPEQLVDLMSSITE